MRMNNHLNMSGTFADVREALRFHFKHHAHWTHPDTWQGVDVSKRPEMKSLELLNVTFTTHLRGVEDLDYWRNDCQPNLPWADDHFDERVCGVPINPGKTWEYWPWASSASDFLDAAGGTMFNHNYMERIWPRFAGKARVPTPTDRDFGHALAGVLDLDPLRGIRGEYGDLNDLVDLLARDPMTRQAYLPLYFPEDTGAPGRKPCSLGYQFMCREDGLHIYYPMRSCDFVRHFNDDCYLAVRLGLWVLDQCRAKNKDWGHVTVRSFSMHCTSLHVFVNDAARLRDEV